MSIQISQQVQRIIQWNEAFYEQYSAALRNDPCPHFKEIHTPSKKLILQTIRAIRDAYNSGLVVEKWRALKLYIGFIQLYASSDAIKRIEQFQFDDMMMAIVSRECMWLRSRRGGKSRDLSLIGIFFAIVGLRVLWFAPASDQLKQATQYFFMNPFCDGVTRNTVKVVNGRDFDLSMLTKGRSASKGTDVLIYDEGGKISTALLQYEYYKYSRAIVADAIWKGDKHIIHASTPCIGTALEVEHNDLKKLSTDLISEHPWQDCWWITEEWVEGERARNLEDPWYVTQEYECGWCVRGNGVFDNVRTMTAEQFGLETEGKRCTHVGVDINKREMAIGVHIDRLAETIYVLFEKEYSWVDDQKCFLELRSQRMIGNGRAVWMDPHALIEFENGGYNEKEALSVRFQIGSSVLGWTDPIKGDRLHVARSMQIIICPAFTPRLHKDLREAVYHPLKAIYLKDNAHPCHYLDAFLHALVSSGRTLLFPKKSEGAKLRENKLTGSKYLDNRIKRSHI